MLAIAKASADHTKIYGHYHMQILGPHCIHITRLAIILKQAVYFAFWGVKA